jgi:YD repeat-containing protein
MMPAAKHGDPQLGIDIHLCTVPPSPSPVPLPTPHMSIVFDSFDYVPVFGATVSVCGMKRATAGTSAIVVHIPPGFPFAPKLPDKEDELFMGSATVVADGDPFSFMSVPVLSCQVAGMPSPFRLKKKGPPKIMLLPTTFNLAIPTNVFVGGPPTVSLMGMAFKAAFKGLGTLAKSKAFKRLRQKLFKNMKPGVLKCSILRAEPVNILTGEVSVEQEDFTLPGCIPIEWTRSYSSGDRRSGLCGHGWETPADARLEVNPADGTVSLRHPSVGPLFFAQLPITQGDDGAELELMEGALLSDQGHEYQVRTKDDRVYHFPKGLRRVRSNGVQEFPISRISDLCGNWLEFERRAGRLIGINESAGRRIEITHKDERISAVALYIPETGARHVLVRYVYDAGGDLLAVVDALGSPYTFAYDAHHMVRHTDRNGLSFYYEYDTQAADGWRITHAWGDGGLYDYRFEYLDALNERRITDSLGHVSIVKLDERGLPISEIDPLGGMTIFEYDEVGRTVGVTDQGGHRTSYEYDERGNLLKLKRPDGKSIQTEFNAANKAVSITDPNGAQWWQKWDDRGLLVEQITPLGNVSCYEYDAHGQLAAFTNPRGARTELAFDLVGNLAGLQDGLGHRTRFAYDVLGNVTAKTDPLGHQTRYRYDAKGRLIQAVLPSGAAIECVYDREDNLIRYVDENGAVTRLEYCGLGEIKRRLQPDGHAVEYHYDTEERLIGVTNQRGEIYHLKRDALGRIVEEVDYWGQGRRYAYDASGYLTSSTDPLGRTIKYTTDPLGRILKKTLPDGFGENFAYDANGNLIETSNAHGAVKREFNSRFAHFQSRFYEMGNCW